MLVVSNGGFVDSNDNCCGFRAFYIDLMLTVKGHIIAFGCQVFLERLRGKDNYDLIRRERLRRSEDAIRGYVRSANAGAHHREAAPILIATDAYITHQRPRQVAAVSPINEPAPQQFATASRAPANCDSALPFLKSMKESGGFFCDDDESWQIRKEIARFQQPKQERTSPGHMRALYQVMKRHND